LQRAEPLIGPDAAVNCDRTVPTDTGTEPDPTHGGQESKTILYFDDGTEWFNYKSPPSDVANEAGKIAGEIRKAADNCYYHIGDYLTAAHQKLEYGYWTAWLRLEVGISPQNAQNYMGYYRFSQNYCADVAKLFLPSVVYRLASAPESVTLLLIKRARAGERITVLDVRQAVYDADQPQQAALIAAGDDRAKYAPDHSGGYKEGDGGDASEADGQLDEKIDPFDDRSHLAADLAEKLITVLSPHPERWWFFVPMHALISDASLCQQVLARVAKGIALPPGRKPGGTSV
jgi:hypothetical protein